MRPLLRIGRHFVNLELVTRISFEGDGTAFVHQGHAHETVTEPADVAALRDVCERGCLNPTPPPEPQPGPEPEPEADAGADAGQPAGA